MCRVPFFGNFNINSIFRLETSELPLRENLAHTIPDEQIIQIDDQLSTVNMDNYLTVFSVEKGTVRRVFAIFNAKFLRFVAKFIYSVKI